MVSNRKRLEKIGIVGFGFAGQLHAQALRSLFPQNQLLITDTDPKKRSLAKKLGYSTRRSLQELLTNNPEAIITAIPPSGNLALTEEIVKNKQIKGILFEKPLASNVAEGKKIEKLVKNASIFGMVGLTGHGFHPEFKKAKELLDTGVLGEIHNIIEQIHQGGPDFPSHYLTNEYGGALKELGIHSIDHLYYLLERRNWTLSTAFGGNDYWHKAANDWCEITLVSRNANFQKPIVSHISLAFVKEFAADLTEANYSTVIVGTKGKMIIYGFDSLELITSEGKKKITFHSQKTNTRDRHLPGFIQEDICFIEAMVHNSVSPVSLPYAIKLQEVVDTIEQRINKDIGKPLS